MLSLPEKTVFAGSMSPDFGLLHLMHTLSLQPAATFALMVIFHGDVVPIDTLVAVPEAPHSPSLKMAVSH